MSNIVNLLISLHESGIDPQTFLKGKRFDFTERAASGKSRSVLEECLDSDVPYAVIQSLLSNKDCLNILTNDGPALEVILKKDLYREAFFDDLLQRSQEDAHFKDKELGFKVFERLVDFLADYWERFDDPLKTVKRINEVFNQSGDAQALFQDYVQKMIDPDDGIPSDSFSGLVKLSGNVFLEGIPEKQRRLLIYEDSTKDLPNVASKLLNDCLKQPQAFKKITSEFKDFTPKIMSKEVFWAIYEGRHENSEVLDFLKQTPSLMWKPLKALAFDDKTIVDDLIDRLEKVHQDDFISRIMEHLEEARVKDLITLSHAAKDYEKRIGEDKEEWLRDVQGVGNFIQLVYDYNRQKIQLDLVPDVGTIKALRKLSSAWEFEVEKFIFFLEERAILLSSGEKLDAQKERKTFKI